MLTYAVLVGLFLLIVVVFVYPKWGSFLVWPILFTYPHYWWSRHQFLPLNIGMDDLFCVGLFLLIVFRRNFMEGQRVRFGFAFWSITMFVLVAAIANGVSTLEARGPERMLYLKDIMKLGVFWGLSYAILHSIDSKRDLRIQLTMFSLASAAGAAILILQYFFPAPMIHWSIPIAIKNVGIQEGGRAAGAFMNANSAACVLACAVMLVTATITLQRTRLTKLFTYGIVGVLLVATMLARSRSGLLALTGAFVCMMLFGRSKRLAVMLVLGAVGVSMSFPLLSSQFSERIAATYDPRSGDFGGSVLGRFRTWQSYFATATVADYVIGQGSRHAIAKNHSESHNAYVSLITVYGVGGVIWAVALCIVFRRKVRQTIACGDPLLSAVAGGCLFALIAWGIYAFASDAISAQYPRYVLFYLLVLIDRASVLARRENLSAPAVQPVESSATLYRAQPA
ncbi:MAG: hypothetical protein IID33_01360 [Planctomycetes bacterium]|nr:hypothetical protein [Planctomycetota bacterium]